MMRKAIALSCLMATVQLFAPSPSSAMTFDEALARAEARDPQWRSALAAHAGSLSQVDQARAAQGFDLALVADTTANSRSDRSHSPDGVYEADRSPNNYNSRSARLQLRRSLINGEGRAAIEQAQRQVKQAEARAQVEYTRLATRVSEAVARLAKAEAAMQATDSERILLARREERARKGYRIGTLKPIEQFETRSLHAAAEAEHQSAVLERALAAEELTLLIGPFGEGERFELPKPLSAQGSPEESAAAFDRMRTRARERAPEIQAAREAESVAALEIKRLDRQDRPTLQLVGSAGNVRSNAGDTPSQPRYNQNIATLGLQLRIPLYDSGLNDAQVRQAREARVQAELAVAASHQDTTLQIRRAELAWRVASLRAAAAREALAYQTEALRSAQHSTGTGLAAELEIIEAEAALARARRALAEAEIEMNQQWLLAELAAGDRLSTRFAGAEH